MPAVLPDDCELPVIPTGDDVRDALVIKAGLSTPTYRRPPMRPLSTPFLYAAARQLPRLWFPALALRGLTWQRGHETCEGRQPRDTVYMYGHVSGGGRCLWVS